MGISRVLVFSCILYLIIIFNTLLIGIRTIVGFGTITSKMSRFRTSITIASTTTATALKERKKRSEGIANQIQSLPRPLRKPPPPPPPLPKLFERGSPQSRLK